MTIAIVNDVVMMMQREMNVDYDADNIRDAVVDDDDVDDRSYYIVVYVETAAMNVTDVDVDCYFVVNRHDDDVSMIDDDNSRRHRHDSMEIVELTIVVVVAVAAAANVIAFVVDDFDAMMIFVRQQYPMMMEVKAMMNRYFVLLSILEP